MAGAFAGDGFAAAFLLPHNDARRARTWSPTRVGRHILLFHGHIDNAAELAARFGLELGGRPAPQDLSRLYGLVLEHGGADPERLIIGEFAAAALDQSSRHLRLARSPLRAPPLHYYADPQRVVAASVPRAIFSCGIEERLDLGRIANGAHLLPNHVSRDFHEGLARVPLGGVVEISPEKVNSRRYYDLLEIQPVRLPSPRDYVEQAKELLRESCRAVTREFSRPGVLLSGGLDSSQVSARMLEVLPQEQGLDSYTFTVEPGWDGVEYPGMYGDERPLVERFAAMHPRLRAHYCDNSQGGFDHRLNEMFLATGIVITHLANFSHYHELWKAARADGCDVMLYSEFGNLTFSEMAYWGFAEYFLKGRWVQLVRALRGQVDDPRPLWRRFAGLSLQPLLPTALWAQLRKVKGDSALRAAASPLRAEYADRPGGPSSIAKGFVGERYFHSSRRGTLRENEPDLRDETNDVLQGFEQIYGMAQRDPTAYRPLFEFCVGSPTEVFMRDGQQRWLAREMGRGIMPEEQRLNRRFGRHGADWHLKMGRRRHELIAELDRLAQSERLNEIFDFPRLRAALEDWPEISPREHIERLPREFAVTRAITLARYINWVEGNNRG